MLTGRRMLNLCPRLYNLSSRTHLPNAGLIPGAPPPPTHPNSSANEQVSFTLICQS